MESASPVVEYRLIYSDEFLLEHFRHYRRAVRRSWILKWLGWPLMIVMVCAAAYAGLVEGNQRMELWLVILATAGFFIWREPASSEKRARKAFTSSPRRGKEISMQVSDSGVHLKDAASESTTSWPSYTAARFFPDGVLLYQGQTITWMPDSGLTHGTRRELEGIVRSKVADSAALD